MNFSVARHARARLDIRRSTDQAMLSQGRGAAGPASPQPKTAGLRLFVTDGLAGFLSRSRRGGFRRRPKDYAIMTADAEGLVIRWNQDAKHIFGYTEQEAPGQKLDMIFLPEDIAVGVPDEERGKAREGVRAEDERWRVRKDGTRLVCSASSPRCAIRNLTDMRKLRVVRPGTCREIRHDA